MARSRSPRWYFTRRGWTVVAVLALILLLALIHAELRSIQQPVWQGEAQAASLAKEQAGLTEVASAEKYVWDEPLWIVRGSTAEGRQLVVWLLPERAPYAENAAESATEEDIRAKLLAAKPDAKLLHVRPAWHQGSPAWEAYYSRTTDQLRYFYEFYDFKTGAERATYSLTAKRSS
ncbi:cell wall elongation regulator TseB-like domain-containing protein [Paenibacillus pasadenensis]|uniref:Cell wall elongation regulator TseB-like domain-containing protein n=1 Tax=Paenibacillus pasadenensis TaxID=217090 RepID=A0A2N5N5V6_9BACL|nr:DUF5590 domain-containing protein [Paenibacillus pasadenensis]PLT45693.1 hypothetical protein B8V81_4124 [Paenibacillus pasadenensis]